MKDFGNFWKGIEYPKEGEAFDELLQVGPVKIERIRSSSTPEPGVYVQTQSEWVILLKGKAVIDIYGREYTLEPGDYLWIPSGVAHEVKSTAQGSLWLAIHIGDQS